MNAGAWGAGIGALCVTPIMGSITHRWATAGWRALGTGRRVVSVLCFLSAALGALIVGLVVVMSAFR